MSKEFKRELYREGFVSALVGIDNTAYPLSDMRDDNELKQAYQLGRCHGIRAKREQEVINLLTQIDELYRSYKPGEFGQDSKPDSEVA